MKQYTYLMRNGKLNHYKIGKSSDARKRQKQLKTAAPNIKLICVGDKVSEAELHLKYKNHRMKGEWFSFSQKTVDEICRELRGVTLKSQAAKYLNYRIPFGKYRGLKLYYMHNAAELRFLKIAVESKQITGQSARAINFWLNNKDEIDLTEIIIL